MIKNSKEWEPNEKKIIYYKVRFKYEIENQ
jgi:hypothetical protein